MSCAIQSSAGFAYLHEGVTAHLNATVLQRLDDWLGLLERLRLRLDGSSLLLWGSIATGVPTTVRQIVLLLTRWAVHAFAIS